MYRTTKRLRVAAIFCLITFLQSLILPSIAHALTSGPSAPEASGFEPVDATDMVNLQTGDFTYSLPVLEVPGPEGGYPLSLSYHAGIRPLQEASWVGLGWSLNAGAINRIVNGYPDDYKGIQRTVDDYWPGGESHTFSVGINFGAAGSPFSMGFNLSVSHDTYRGFDGDIGVQAKMGIFDISANGSGIRAGVSKSFGPLNLGINSDFNGNIGYSVSQAANLGGLQAQVGVKNGVGFASASLGALGASLRSNSSKPDFTIGGGGTFSTQNNNYQISTISKGFTIPFTTIGYSYQRYWIHETDNVFTYGSYYADDSKPMLSSTTAKVVSSTNQSFDCYPLLDKEKSIVDERNPDKLLGGSYPAYDAFMVSGQGIGGNLQPYSFENASLYRKRIRYPNNANGFNDELTFRLPSDFDKSVHLRQPSDFSSYLLHNGSPTLDMDYYDPSASATSFSTPTGGFNNSKYKLAGSKNVETFTNLEIASFTGNTLDQGFIGYPGISDNFRTTAFGGALLHQIGGYSITNASGVTYHYALPVYTYDEIMKSEKDFSLGGTEYNTQDNSAPYAYTWLLTAITGSDFIDRNNGGVGDGFANEGDYGYWVTFEYGKWLDDYKWRTPFTGRSLDVNKQVEQHSYGSKEIYYLDAIKTRSHTALFVKDIRKDGKSVTSGPNGDCTILNRVECGGLSATPVGSGLPLSLLRLDKIYLYKNSVLEANNWTTANIRNISNPYYENITFTTPACTATVAYHNCDNVIDVQDINSLGVAINDNALKVVDFDNDHYDLCPETPNSFNNTQLYNFIGQLGEKQGKLNLKGVKFLGNGGNDIMPGINFDYENDNPASYTFNIQSINTSNGTVSIPNGGQDVMNKVISYQNGGNSYYLYVYHNWGTADYYYRVLGEKIPTTAHSGTCTVTKNPPFTLDRYDAYGYYKPDFIYTGSTNMSGGTDIQRIVTPSGAEMLDAWSLKEIETSIGAKIKMKYSPKTYKHLVKQSKTRLNVNRAEVVYDLASNSDLLKIRFDENIRTDEFFDVGDPLKVTLQWTSNAGQYYLNTYDVTVVSIHDSNTADRHIKTTNVNPIGGGGTLTTSPAEKGFVDFDCGECMADGIKVDEVEVTNGIRSRKTKYAYDGGTSSYVPTYGHNPDPYVDVATAYYDNLYNRKFNEPLMELYALAREIPSPGVLYKQVEITEEENGLPLPGKRRYTFRTFESDMVTIDYTPIVEHSLNGLPNYVEGMSQRTVTISDKTAQIGSLLKHEMFDKNGLLVSQVINDYVDDEEGENETEYADYNNQGIVHQGFNEMRNNIRYEENSAIYNLKGVVSLRREYPAVLKSTTNYADGTSMSTYNRKYDIFSGAKTEVESEDGYGQHFITKSIPAYTIYPTMGLKIHDIHDENRQMLTQNTATYVFNSDGDGNTIGNPISANVTTWKKNWQYREYNLVSKKYEDQSTSDPNQVWRKYRNYTYRDGTNPDGTFNTWSTFPYGNVPPAEWTKLNEVTRYDHFSKPLEELGINGLHAAAKMGYDETMPIITSAPSKYVEMAFSSAEDKIDNQLHFGGEVRSPYEVAISTNRAHTGDHSIKLDATNRYGFTYEIPVNATSGTPHKDKIDRKKYEARVWIHEENTTPTFGYFYCSYKNSSGTIIKWTPAKIEDAATVKAGEWYQLRIPIDFDDPLVNTCTSLSVGVWVPSISTDVYFDDFRFAPVDASTSCYVYDDATDRLSYVLDQEHFYTQYLYDDAGRLIQVYQETTENPTGKRLVTENEYHYKRPF